MPAVLEKQGHSCLISNDQPLLQEEEEKTPVPQGRDSIFNNVFKCNNKISRATESERSETEMEE